MVFRRLNGECRLQFSYIRQSSNCFSAAVLFLFSFFCSELCAKPVIPSGSGDFVFNYESPGGIKKIKVYYCCPQKLTKSSRIVFTMHGDNRSGSRYRDEWKKYAVKYNFLVISPELAENVFDYWKYNCGNVYDKKKESFNPKEQWTFNLIEQLFDFVKADKQMQVGSYCIYGHSSGAQFVQKLVLFMPEARFSMAIANGAGWHTFPNFERSFYYGIKNSSLTDEMLRKSFKKNLIILMGAKDNMSRETQKSYFKSHKYDRLYRTRIFYSEAKSKAEQMGAEFNWVLRLVPNADHNDPKHALFSSRYVARSPKDIRKK